MDDRDRLERCDFLDVLEEAAVVKVPVRVRLKSGEAFEDRVEDVETADGEDWVLFAEHDRVAVSDISDCSRATPLPSGYDPRAPQGA